VHWVDEPGGIMLMRRRSCCGFPRRFSTVSVTQCCDVGGLGVSRAENREGLDTAQLPTQPSQRKPGIWGHITVENILWRACSVMPISVSPMKEEDIDGAITTIQEAFASDPYNLWIYNDRSKVCGLSSVSPLTVCKSEYT